MHLLPFIGNEACFEVTIFEWESVWSLYWYQLIPCCIKRGVKWLWVMVTPVDLVIWLKMIRGEREDGHIEYEARILVGQATGKMDGDTSSLATYQCTQQLDWSTLMPVM